MNTLSYKTISANKETAQKEWVIVDAENATVGRLSTVVAMLLRGKYKPNFTPHVDCGDNVIIINAEKVVFKGNKMETKEYIRHTGYPGGQRVRTFDDLIKTRPEEVLRHSVKGMLPKNKLGRAILRNLYIYAGSEHPHQGQQPKEIDLSTIK